MSADKLAYSPTEAARAIGVSKATIWRLVAAGELETRKLGTRTLILREQLEALLARAPGAA